MVELIVGTFIGNYFRSGIIFSGVGVGLVVRITGGA